MSLHLPRTRVTQTATSCLLHSRPRHLLLPHRRTLFDWMRNRRHNEPPRDAAPFDPESLDFKKRIADSRRAAQHSVSQTQGDLASSSIFGADEGASTPKSRTTDSSSSSDAPSTSSSSLMRLQHDAYLTAPTLDPQPATRRRWLRKQVARAVRTQGAISKDVARRRREREHTRHSEWLPTSQKKLMPVARQIAGKTVAEALTQLRFSSKLVAQDVARNLRVAHEEAMAGRGMGLGLPSGTLSSATGSEEGRKVTIITDKKGKRRTIADPTEMYIAQAWINRGPYGRLPEYRARGKMNVLRPPYTRIAFLLKEEKTRIREAQEREAKARNKKPWVHHPDRPIQQRGQYVLW